LIIKEKIIFFNFLDKYHDVGLLILRVGIGIMFVFHGFPKLTAGRETLATIGGSSEYMGVNFTLNIWGYMAAFSELVGGILLILGFFTRTACFFMLDTMIVATKMHFGKDDSFQIYSHSMELGILFLSLILIGPGRYSLDGKTRLAGKFR